MIKRDVNELASELAGIGFTEIKLIPLKNLTTGRIRKERTVQQVLIQGIGSIKKGMSIEYDQMITIQYNSFKD